MSLTAEETQFVEFLNSFPQFYKEAYKIAECKYKTGEFILDPGECQYKQIAITKPSSESTEWREF